MIETKERGIIMSGYNPKLILEGRKTQTRRIVNFHHSFIRCPYGVAGDRLWVRETFAWADKLVDGFERADPVLVAYRSDGAIIRHECNEQQILTDDSWNLEHPSIRWRPSIHMPRWASRITLEITKVHVERLQDISEQDCADEGIVEIHRSLYRHGRMNGYGLPGTPPEEAASTRKNAYADLWDSLHGKGAWDKNPWVWVIEFKKI